MAWTIEYADTAKKQITRLDRRIAARIIDYLEKRVATADNPRNIGKPLKGPLGELWRYRVGDYRVICEIEDHRLLILVARVGNRREVYR